MPRPKTVWTDENVEKLKSLYSTTENSELARVFATSITAINRKAFDLRLRKQKFKWTKEMRAIVKDKMYLGTNEVARIVSEQTGVKVLPYRVSLLISELKRKL